MKRRWVGVAVIAGCLGLVQAARAQLPPAQAGADSMPEPIPFRPDAGPTNLVPGPLSPQTAPQGPPDYLSLPADAPGAFPTKRYDPEEAFYFNIGAQLLRRQSLSNSGVIAVLDPQLLDTGTAAPAGAAVAQKFSDINPHQNGGPRATFGYLFNTNQAFELTGFYIFESNQTTEVLNPGRVDSFFFNPPLGFEGDNGLWLQADRLSTTLSTTLFGAEANYRYTDAAVMGAELIMGVRYLDLAERLTTRTDDDGFSFPMVNGLPDPTRIATYSVQTHNRLVAPQLGFEWDKSFTKFLTLGFMAKGAWGADFVDMDRNLIRGDGLHGFAGKKSDIQFGQMYEMNAFVDFNILERARLRLGYNALWFLNMANVVDQYDFNLKDANNLNRRSGSIYFQGPMAELQFLF